MSKVNDSEEHASVAIFLKDLFSRAEIEAKDALRVKKRRPSEMTEQNAHRFLNQLPSLRERLQDESPSWGYLREVVILASQLPSAKTDDRLWKRRQVEAGRARNEHRRKVKSEMKQPQHAKVIEAANIRLKSGTPAQKLVSETAKAIPSYTPRHIRRILIKGGIIPSKEPE